MYQIQFLVDKAGADFFVVVYLVNDVRKDISHRKNCDLALVLAWVVAEWNSVSYDNLLKGRFCDSVICRT